MYSRMIVESNTVEVVVDEAGTSRRGLAASNSVIGAEEVGHLRLERHALFEERDLDLLGVGRKRVLVELDHATSSGPAGQLRRVKRSR